MSKRKTNLTLSTLRAIADTTGKQLRVNILDQFAEDLLLTFLNNKDTEPLDYDGNLIDCLIEHKIGSRNPYLASDTMKLIDGEDFFLNYEFEVDGDYEYDDCHIVHNLTIYFTKLEFNFLRETWDMLDNSYVQDRLVHKMNEYESQNMTLV